MSGADRGPGAGSDRSSRDGPVGDGPVGNGVVGVGVDAVDVGRFRTVLGRRPGLVARLFTEAERADADRSGDPVQRLAARFAAKEATMKVLGTGIGGFALRDVEVVRGVALGAAAGAPSLRLGPGAAAVAERRGVARWHVSMTHTAGTAVAMVLAEGRAVRAPDPG